MSLISENIIPGEHGKIFETNAKTTTELEKISNAIRTLKGVTDVRITENTFPKEIKIYTSSLVKVEDVERTVINAGFHALPKSIFGI